MGPDRSRQSRSRSARRRATMAGRSSGEVPPKGPPPMRAPTFLLTALLLASPAHADPPTASYVFPAGARRGTAVKVRVGGLYLYDCCGWELLGKGTSTSSALVRTQTRWFEGPMLPLPASQQAENYPQDMLGEVR